MSDGRAAYVASLVEESLGLVKGQLDRHPLPRDVVDQFAGVLRGAEPSDIGLPVLEMAMANTLAELRKESLEEDGFFLRKARWPGAARFAVCLTHDVDNVSRPRGHIWRTRSRFSLPDLLGGLLGIVDLYDNIELIRSREGRCGFRSSFYFLTSNYPLGEVRAEAARARSEGWDVGLHGDFGTHDSLEQMDAAVKRFSDGLGFRPTGLREHYLKFDFAKSWEVMERASFEYDTTVGTNDRLGFRLGLASPFHPPDGSWVPLNLIELPLTLMDTTLWGYLKETEQDGLADALRFVDLVERVEGLLTLLWHQEAVRMRGGRLYWRILEEFKGRGCYVATGQDIARWWRARSVPMSRDGKLIRLEADPPDDLVLRLEVAEGRTPQIRSASLEGTSPSWLLKRPAKAFELEVV